MRSIRRGLAAGVAMGLLAMTSVRGDAQAQGFSPAGTDEAEMPPEMWTFMQGFDPSNRVTTLEAWDRVIDAFTQTSWRLHESVTQAPPEEPAAAFAAIWDKYVLAADAKARLDELRSRARRESEAHDDKALQKTIAEAAPLIADQKFRFIAVLGYPAHMSMFDAHRAALRPWLERASDADRTKADQLFAAGEREILGRLDEIIQSPDHTLQALMRASSAGRSSREKLNELRLNLVDAQKALPNPVALDPRSNLGTCPPPAQSMSPREVPAIDTANFPSSTRYYPQNERRADIEGSPVVRASISDTGCVLKVEIASTSGSAALDSAALDFSLAGRYLPASKDGKAVPGIMQFRVKFELR